MKIVNLSQQDYANYAYTNMRALQAAGVDCESYCMDAHSFNYAQQSQRVRKAEMIAAAERADIIQVFHTSKKIYDLIRHLKKPIVVYHTGTRYRQAHEEYNEVFKDVHRVLTDSPEFMYLGGKRVAYMPYAVDTNAIQFVPYRDRPPVFGHFPSRPETKGTNAIVKAMEGIDVPFVTSVEQVSHKKNLHRIAECDAYIEMLNMTQGGKPYGSFGVTAFEAAAMGHPVITNCAHPEVYWDAYGSEPLFFANTVKELKIAVKRIFKDHSEEMRGATRRLVRDRHGLKPSGERILKLILD